MTRNFIADLDTVSAITDLSLMTHYDANQRVYLLNAALATYQSLSLNERTSPYGMQLFETMGQAIRDNTNNQTLQSIYSYQTQLRALRSYTAAALRQDAGRLSKSVIFEQQRLWRQLLDSLLLETARLFPTTSHLETLSDVNQYWRARGAAFIVTSSSATGAATTYSDLESFGLIADAVAGTEDANLFYDFLSLFERVVVNMGESKLRTVPRLLELSKDVFLRIGQLQVADSDIPYLFPVKGYALDPGKNPMVPVILHASNIDRPDQIFSVSSFVSMLINPSSYTRRLAKPDMTNSQSSEFLAFSTWRSVCVLGDCTLVEGYRPALAQFANSPQMLFDEQTTVTYVYNEFLNSLDVELQSLYKACRNREYAVDVKRVFHRQFDGFIATLGLQFEPGTLSNSSFEVLAALTQGAQPVLSASGAHSLGTGLSLIHSLRDIVSLAINQAGALVYQENSNNRGGFRLTPESEAILIETFRITLAMRNLLHNVSLAGELAPNTLRSHNFAGNSSLIRAQALQASCLLNQAQTIARQIVADSATSDIDKIEANLIVSDFQALNTVIDLTTDLIPVMQQPLMQLSLYLKRGNAYALLAQLRTADRSFYIEHAQDDFVRALAISNGYGAGLPAKVGKYREFLIPVNDTVGESLSSANKALSFVRTHTRAVEDLFGMLSPNTAQTAVWAGQTYQQIAVVQLFASQRCQVDQAALALANNTQARLLQQHIDGGDQDLNCTHCILQEAYCSFSKAITILGSVYPNQTTVFQLQAESGREQLLISNPELAGEVNVSSLDNIDLSSIDCDFCEVVQSQSASLHGHPLNMACILVCAICIPLGVVCLIALICHFCKERPKPSATDSTPVRRQAARSGQGGAAPVSTGEVQLSVVNAQAQEGADAAQAQQA